MKIKKDFNNISLLDPADVFCKGQICSQTIVNESGVTIPTVHDDDHVSIESALFMGRKKAHELNLLIQ